MSNPPALHSGAVGDRALPDKAPDRVRAYTFTVGSL